MHLAYAIAFPKLKLKPRSLSYACEKKNVSGAILMFQLRYMKNIVSFRFSDPKGIGSDGYISDDLRERAEKRVARW